MVSYVTVPEKTYLIRCMDCHSLLICDPGDILEPCDFYNFATDVKGKCPKCGMFYGRSTQYVDDSLEEKVYFKADIVDILEPAMEEGVDHG